MKVLYIVLITALAVGCNNAENKTPKTEEEVIQEQPINMSVDSRPGIKGIYLGMTLDEISDRVKKVYPGTSHLDIKESVLLDPESTVTFSLADSLHILGEYPIHNLYGQAYNDTIINLRVRFENEEAIKGMPEVLLDVYGIPDIELMKYNIFHFEGRKYKVKYSRALGMIEFIDKDFQWRMQIDREDTMKVKPVEKAVDDF
ncbi:MAG: hypothetical protein WD357_09020 [Gracilimonas sp.]